MQNRKKNFNRITALVALVATLFVLLFSTVYLVEHADHQCVAGDCPVCTVMSQCSNNLKLISTAIILIGAGWLLLAEGKKNDTVSVSFSFCNSLISQKVRLNN